MENVLQFPPPTELSDSQRVYWEERLRDIEIARAYALKVLGMVAIDNE